MNNQKAIKVIGKFKLIGQNKYQIQLQQTQHIEANVFQIYLNHFCQNRLTHLKDWISYPSKQGIIDNDSHETYHCKPSICSFSNEPIGIWPFKINPRIGFLIF